MRLKTGVQMDPIEKINIRGDSTFALLLEAQKRQHSIFYYTPDKLILRGGRAFAEGHELRVHDVEGAHFELGARQNLALDELDVIHLRQDPPFDMAYITTTHILDSVHPKTLVVNDPTSVRNAPEKLFVTQFPDLMPPTLIARTLDDVTAFREEFGDIIVKPLYGNGGAAVFRIKPDDTNTGSLVELFQTVFREPFVVQRYLPDVRAGDKRIILVDGEPVGAINRVPAANETRSNMHVGGRPEATDLTPREREICAAIGPELKKRGLIFVGIDVIGDYLTEINVTSPTGIREVKRFGEADIAALVWDVVEEKVRSVKVP
ncbi:glutathione synthase [Rhodomicrobium vannielii ATCC 17100]|uniref:glutathione synthase n=1 Tax=Rhodomicrobium vannielii TaxID=1069 RepID=UPI00191AF9CA|nr:glutathione synthase [Rhodomicrobium vannielii]MBJ7533781.1 glutathione synthase [Rhodomicrobium vannielii ATCC 17100]